MYEIDFKNTGIIHIALGKASGEVKISLWDVQKQLVLLRVFNALEPDFTLNIRTHIVPDGTYLLVIENAILTSILQSPKLTPTLPGEKAKFYTAALHIAQNTALLDGRLEYNGFIFNVFPNLKFPGLPLGTPAQIVGKDDPLADENDIEIGREEMLSLSIEMRLMVLLHEYAHNFINKVQSNEQEADYWALQMFIGANYPLIKLPYGKIENGLIVANSPMILAQIEYNI